MALPRRPAGPPGRGIVDPVLMPCTGGWGPATTEIPTRDATSRRTRPATRTAAIAVVGAGRPRRITSPQEPAVTASGYAHTPRRKAQREVAMARCETCGNDYDKAFQVSMNGTDPHLRQLRCAIHALAPTCENCGIRIVGHGLEKDGTFFCCEHCAEVVGVTGSATASARRPDAPRSERNHYRSGRFTTAALNRAMPTTSPSHYFPGENRC